jgi:hypothetical protein
MHPLLAFSSPHDTPTGPACSVSWGGAPIATLYRTDTPENDLWEPGMPGPVRVPGFTVYTLRSTKTGAILSSTNREALLDELADRLAQPTT